MFSMDAPAPEAQNPPPISIPVPQEWRQGEVRVQNAEPRETFSAAEYQRHADAAPV